METELKPQRRIRSFALRTGRMTEGQQKSYDQGWQKFGLNVADGLINTDVVFERTGAPLVFEVGFGMGQSVAEMAIAEPDHNFVGVEVHTPGVAKLMMLCLDSDISNVRIYEHDAIDVLAQCIPKASIDRFQLYFPDPWHKNKHHKRRIVQTSFLDILAEYIKTGGVMHFATDWQNYAEHMMKVVSKHDCFENVAGAQKYSPRPDWRPYTKFERRGHRLGHGVWDLIFTRK